MAEKIDTQRSQSPQLLTIPEAVEIAGVTSRTLMRWLASGLLPAHHPGRGSGPAKGRDRVRISGEDLYEVLRAKKLNWPGRVEGAEERKAIRQAAKDAKLTPKQIARAKRKAHRLANRHVAGQLPPFVETARATALRRAEQESHPSHLTIDGEK